MANDLIQQSTDFNINELSILSKGGKKIDVREMFEELNLYDSILTPVRSGNILIRDTQGLSEILSFDGTEYLVVNIEKNDNSPLQFTAAFRIYKQSLRQKENETSESYILHFVADEYVYSSQQRINQTYEGTYADAAVAILTDYLKIPLTEFRGKFDLSYGVRNFVIPNLTPLEAIDWCAKRAIDENGAPAFVFFQNQFGFNFCSLSSIAKQNPTFKINYNVKNLTDDVGDEILGARGYKILNQFDFLKNTSAGVYSGTFIGFDPITRTVSKGTQSFLDIYGKMKHSNQQPNLSADKNREGKFNFEMTDSRKSVYSFAEAQKYSSYVKQRDPTSISKINDSHNYILQRKSILESYMNKRIRVLMPGNFGLTSGFNVNMKFPARTEKNEQREDLDSTLNGNYSIIATRHIIKYNIHETVIDVASDSSQKQVAARLETVDTGRIIYT
jgi:hypothetical protein